MSSDTLRRRAKKRAKRMYRILFQPNIYGPIMVTLNKPDFAGKEAEFKGKLPSGFTAEEKDWLWNYLKECHKNTTANAPGGWGPNMVKEAPMEEIMDFAASSGW